MDTAVLEQLLDETFDHALVHHGFTPYLRDYEMIVYATAAPSTGVAPAYRRYLFRHCVRARCETTVAGPTWRTSLDDRLTDAGTADGLDGYVWGVGWHCLYPGATLLPPSRATRRWAKAVGTDFHEVRVETNAHRIELLFSDLRVDRVPVGYAPFTTD
jgi:hypothetical protein